MVTKHHLIKVILQGSSSFLASFYNCTWTWNIKIRTMLIVLMILAQKTTGLQFISMIAFGDKMEQKLDKASQ